MMLFNIQDIQQAKVRSNLKISLEIVRKHLFTKVFDKSWFIRHYALEGSAKKYPFLYFAFQGIFRNQVPNSTFITKDYIEINPDVLKYDNLPVIHYIIFGYFENRSCRIPAEINRSEEYLYETYIECFENGLAQVVPLRAGPRISILCPVHEISLEMLKYCMESVIHQSASNWELCVTFSDAGNQQNQAYLQAMAAKDARIKLKEINNQGISQNSNEALSMASGEFICLLDHDDVLAPHAIEVLNRAILKQPGVDFFYSDKDQLNHSTGKRCNPLLKPAWSPEILYSANYLTHLNVIRRSLVEQIGGFRSRTDGAQDWDLFLRVTELTQHVERLPHILYHWRIHERSTSSGMQAKPYAEKAQLLCIQEALDRRKLAAKIKKRGDHYLFVEWADVARIPLHIIIDGRNCPGLRIAQMLLDIQKEHIHASIEEPLVTVILSGKESPELPNIGNLKVQTRYINSDLKMTAEVVDCIKERALPGQVLIFLSGDLDTLHSGWLREFAGWTGLHEEIGFCGGIILNGKDRVSSSACIVSDEGKWMDLFEGSAFTDHTFLGDIRWYRNCSAVVPWFASMKLKALEESDLFDIEIPWEEAFISGCLSSIHLGYRGLLNPWLVAHSVDLQMSKQHFELSFRSDPYFHPGIAAVRPLTLLRTKTQKENAWQPDKYNLDALAIAGAFSQIESISNTSKSGVGHRETSEPEYQKRCRWFIPGIVNPYYGGAMTIFRFADYLSRHGNYENQFIVISDEDTTELQDKIRGLFPSLATASCINIIAFDDLETDTACINIATLWTTAYVLRNRVRKGLFLYFIQDFEPSFYAAGSMYAMAEHTYRLGFDVIANTKYLLDLQKERYGGNGTWFTPQVDTNVFYPPVKKVLRRTWRRIFFYARPQHPRNGFELAVTALKLLKRKLGHEVEILCAGDEFDVDAFGLQGVVTSLGILDYAQTADLYRTCDIGFTLMLSEHPSYLPLELMASGVLLVTNVNEASKWLLKDNENCLLTWPVPDLLAKRLEDAVIHFDNYREIQQNGTNLIHTTLNDWESAFAGPLEYVEAEWNMMNVLDDKIDTF